MSFAARHVVLAAGAWNQDLLPTLLGPAAPKLRVTQQQVVHFPQREPADDWPVMVHQDQSFVFGMPAGSAAPGAIKLGEHDQGMVTTAGSRDGVVDPRCVERLVTYVERFLPSLVPEPFAASSCLYTSTPSEDFVIDSAGPVIACSPCSGHGAKFAAYTGELVAGIVAGAGSPPDRFTLRRHSL
jgi:sarcosine oxidase